MLGRRLTIEKNLAAPAAGGASWNAGEVGNVNRPRHGPPHASRHSAPRWKNRGIFPVGPPVLTKGVTTVEFIRREVLLDSHLEARRLAMPTTIPSERKFQIYHAVESQRLSRRDAARRFGVSCTRVQQVVTEVRSFVMRHGSGELLASPPELCELRALRLCYERLAHFYDTLMRQWSALSGDDRSVAASIRLLHAAMRISVEQTKLAGRIAKLQVAAQEEGTAPASTFEVDYDEEGAAAEGPDELPPSAPAMSEYEASNGESLPPVGGCTEFGDSGAESVEEEWAEVQDIIATLGGQPTLEEFRAEAYRRAAQRVGFRPPVQPR
jgi:hypothetical protein